MGEQEQHATLSQFFCGQNAGVLPIPHCRGVFCILGGSRGKSSPRILPALPLPYLEKQRSSRIFPNPRALIPPQSFLGANAGEFSTFSVS